MKLTKIGFTLVELLLAVAIIGIILALAYPSYTHYVTKTHRTDGQIALMELTARMERYYLENNHTYVGATFEKLNTTNTSPRGYYDLELTSLSDTTFTLKALPKGAQLANDKLCGTLTVDQLGQKGQTGTGTPKDCW